MNEITVNTFLGHDDTPLTSSMDISGLTTDQVIEISQLISEFSVATEVTETQINPSSIVLEMITALMAGDPFKVDHVVGFPWLRLNGPVDIEIEVKHHLFSELRDIHVEIQPIHGGLFRVTGEFHTVDELDIRKGTIWATVDDEDNYVSFTARSKVFTDRSEAEAHAAAVNQVVFDVTDGC